MTLLLNWRVWLLGFALVLYPVLYAKGRLDGRKLEKAEYTSAVAQANREDRAREQRRQRNVDDAATAAAARERGILASADRARSERDGLRDTLDAVERASAESLSASNKALRVTSELLGSCTREYLSVAEAADRADNEARELRAAWPK